MSYSPTNDPGATPALASRFKPPEPDSSAPWGARTAPMLRKVHWSKKLPVPNPATGSLSPYENINSNARPAVGAPPPFPVPGGLLMISKSPDEARVQRFNDVLRRIEPPLIDHLLKWAIRKPQHKPTAIRLVMLGQSEDDAKMYMVVFCEERMRRRAKKFFSSPLAVELCKPQGAPEHAIEVLVVDPPIPVACAVAQLPAKHIYGSDRENGFCGAPMWFYDPESSATRQVTLGGILQVTRDRGPELFGMTVGHAIEEVESPRSQDIAEDEHHANSDSESEAILDSCGHDGNDDEEAAPKSAGGDIVRPHPKFWPPEQHRENPWESNSMILTALKANPGPEITTYFDWALVDIGDAARTSGVFNVPKTVGFQVRSLLIPPNRNIDKREGSPITLMSSEGPKAGTISFLPSRLIISPGRTFIDTYMIQLSGLVYGHLVATDIIGSGHVVPLLDTIDDIKERLRASSVRFPDSADTRALPPDSARRSDPRSWDPFEPRLESRRHGLANASPFNPRGPRSPSPIPEDSHASWTNSYSDSQSDDDSSPVTTTVRDRQGNLVFESTRFARHQDNNRSSSKPELMILSEPLIYALRFLDTEVMTEVREELERNRKGMFTHKLAWVSQKPGTTIMWNEDIPSLPLSNGTGPGIDIRSPGPFVVLPLRSTPRDAPDHITFSGWKLEYNGQCFGRVTYRVALPPFHGKRPMGWRVVDTASGMGSDVSPDVAHNIRNGMMYWNLVQKIQCRQYTADAADQSRRAIDSLVMIDCQEAMKQNPEYVQKFMEDWDTAPWSVECPQPNCAGHEEDINQPEAPKFTDYVPDLESKEALSNDQYLLFPSTIQAFVLSSQTWEQLHVGNLTVPKWNMALINTLVMDVRKKQRLTRFFEAHNRAKKSMILATRGKENGLVIVLHGQAGLGKTLTAESMTTYVREPMMSLSLMKAFGDSRDPGDELTEVLRLANLWGLVVHITDADLLYERKPTEYTWWQGTVRAFINALDVNRRSLIILETRLTGNFGQYVLSRTHAQVYYSQFSQDEIRYVWNNLIAKFEALGISFSHGARDFIKSAKMEDRDWNGSEMRRVIESAVAMATPIGWPEEHGEEEGEDKPEPFVDILDLEDAVELSGGFGKSEVVRAQGSDEILVDSDHLEKRNRRLR
ncbi:hypothetical protein PG995_006516 [Apiospora arundinis]